MRTQLYLSTMMSDLRQFQRQNRLPAFSDFMECMINREDLSPSQKVPLRQRLEVLRHFVAESESNKDLLSKQVVLRANIYIYIYGPVYIFTG